MKKENRKRTHSQKKALDRKTKNIYSCKANTMEYQHKNIKKIVLATNQEKQK